MSESIERRKDLESGWYSYRMRQGDLTVEVVPEAGCNVQSIQYRGTELLRLAPSLPELRGTRYGVPILYPTPNRVREGRFTFDGHRYEFPANHGANFIHGLVCRDAWEVVEVRERVDRTGISASACEIECQFAFRPGTRAYELFPHPHVLRLIIRVTNDRVRWTYRVDNSLGTTTIPFGFGLHPWIRYLGDRQATFVSVPATHWMQSQDLLPTGRLVELSETPIDLRAPRTLRDLIVDDVYFGMESSRPATIEHRDLGIRITLGTSEEFTHAVVFTPEGNDSFCVENQTCSTDAHNLYAAGLNRAAHLLLVEAGSIHEGHVEWANSHQSID